MTLNFIQRIKVLFTGKVALPKVETPKVTQSNSDSAYQLLGMLEREGRLLDFLKEDIQSYQDAQIGAAVRVVHEGCRKVLDQYFDIQPISELKDNAPITLEEGFDVQAYNLTGEISGGTPFKGRLCHHGWQVVASNLPSLNKGVNITVLKPAEVSL